MYVTLTSLVCFTNVYHLKRIICLEKGVPEGKMAAASATGEKLPMFVVGKSKTHDVLKILSNSLPDIEAKRKLG